MEQTWNRTTINCLLQVQIYFLGFVNASQQPSCMAEQVSPLLVGAGVDILPAAEVGITDLLGDGVTAIAAGELEVTVGAKK